MAGKILVDIDRDGNATITVVGVKGKKCRDLTKALEEAIGKVTMITPTAEYHQVETVRERQAAHR